MQRYRYTVDTERDALERYREQERCSRYRERDAEIQRYSRYRERCIREIQRAREMQ